MEAPRRPAELSGVRWPNRAMAGMRREEDVGSLEPGTISARLLIRI